MMIIYHTIILAIFIILPSFVVATENIQIKSVVIFNTSCARCHEGECSGRMTFHLPKTEADQHIRRHGGKFSMETNRQLYELLRYMKEECSFYPLSVSLAQDRIWGSEKLSTFRSSSNKAYFVPLGRLEPGLYKLLLEGLDDSSKYCIEIVNSDFDCFDEKRVSGESEKTSLQFQADVHSEYYLRILSKKPINLKRIELLASEENSANH
ncbi:MAG: hypothetical protein GY753_01605 [Gammaproteobacteria bacterium]|nr:hypothetical protein [Gammaproteobacteria bacterium]